jgi:Domain of Unknown Function (DUF748)
VLRLFRTTIARIVLGVAVLVGLYALAGFVIAPKVLRSKLLEEIPKTLNVTPTVGDIHINPFLFKLDLKNFALATPDGRKLLGFDRLFVDFDLSSLWHRAYTFDRIELDAPVLNASVAPDGVINLMALKPKPSPPAVGAKPPAKNEPLPAVRIASFKVASGSVSYEDKSRPSVFAARLEPITFELKNFTTGVAGGLFTFTGASKLGERIEWHGHLSVQPVASDGELHIEALQMHTLWAYLEDQLNFVVASGAIDVQTSYKFSLTDQVNLALDVAKATVSNLAVRPKDSDTDWVTLAGLDMSGAAIDLTQRSGTIDSLSLTGLKVLAWLEPDGAVNLLKLAMPAAPPGAVPAAGSPGTARSATTSGGAVVTTTPSATVAPWKIDLHEFALREASISAEDRTVQPAAKVLLAPLSLSVQGASLDLAKPVRVTLDTKINESGSLAVDGEVTPRPLAATVKVKLAGIDLTAAQPYIAQRTAMILRSGKLGGALQIGYGAAKPAIKLAGDLYVEKLHTVDAALHEDLVNWERLDVKGLDMQQGPDRLEIAEIAARKPYARVIIESDTTLNVTRVLQGPGGAHPTPTSAAGPAPAAAAATPVTSKPTKRDAKTVTVKTVAVKPSAAAAPALPMAIKKIRLEAGRLDFTDLSIQPHFSAGILDLKGSVLGLSSDPASRAKVDLHGEVDQFSPVSINGEVNVLSAALYTDLTMSFQNIELSIFNPYSGRFAGYNIAKGKLTTDMHYKVVDRKLDAQHHIVIDQLEFGEKTSSKDAVSLPVKLAVSLLKDRNGVIDLPLPVTGSLDDPKFRVWPIIWKVLVNLLEKAVTAPFALLGSLFGSGPELQFIDFQPGSSDLSAAQSDKVKALVKALDQRPQLKLEVPIAAVPAVDGPALVATTLQSQIAEVQAETSKGGKKGASQPAPSSIDQLDPAVKLDVLTRLYARDFGGEPQYPDSVTAIKQKPELTTAKIDFLTTALHDHITVGEDQLTALGQQRALALQRALLTDTGIDAARIFLVANNKAKEQDGGVRLELSLR